MGDADLDNLRQDVADTTAAIKELSDSQDSINTKLDTVLHAVTRLATLSDTEAARCPYRETISIAANNKRRLEKAEADLMDVKLKIAGFVVLGGIIVPLGMSLLGKWLGI